MVFIKDDIPAKFSSADTKPIEGLYIELNFHKRKWLISCSYMMRCAICYHLYKLKNVKNIHGGMLLLVKFQAFSLQLY